jgi:hypothetical protein
MMKKTIVTLTFCLLGSWLAVAQTTPTDPVVNPPNNNQKIEAAKKDVQQDQRDLQKDKQLMKQEKADLQRDEKSGNAAAVAKDKAAIEKLKADVSKDQQGLKQDRQQISKMEQKSNNPPPINVAPTTTHPHMAVAHGGRH